MQNKFQAYNQTKARASLSPRELEAEVLIKAAAKLAALKRDWEPTVNALDAPLAYNREIWAIFMAATEEPDCPMPAEMQRNIRTLGRFVINHSMKLLFEPAREKLDVLIEINQNLAAGLRAKAA